MLSPIFLYYFSNLIMSLVKLHVAADKWVHFSVIKIDNIITGLEQPLHWWSGIFTREVHTFACQNWGIPQKCALSKIESEGIFIFQAGLHIAITVKQHFLLNYLNFVHEMLVRYVGKGLKLIVLRTLYLRMHLISSF